jgi:hypothetical protein
MKGENLDNLPHKFLPNVLGKNLKKMWRREIFN